MHLARVPTAILYDEKGNVCVISSDSTRALSYSYSFFHRCGRAISYLHVVLKQ